MHLKNWRSNSILALFTIFGLLLISRLFFIQVVQGDFYKALAQGLQGSSDNAISERGEIFFRDGEPLAINMEWPFVFASPRDERIPSHLREPIVRDFERCLR